MDLKLGDERWAFPRDSRCKYLLTSFCLTGPVLSGRNGHISDTEKVLALAWHPHRAADGAIIEACGTGSSGLPSSVGVYCRKV